MALEIPKIIIAFCRIAATSAAAPVATQLLMVLVNSSWHATMLRCYLFEYVFDFLLHFFSIFYLVGAAAVLYYYHYFVASECVYACVNVYSFYFIFHSNTFSTVLKNVFIVYAWLRSRNRINFQNRTNEPTNEQVHINCHHSILNDSFFPLCLIILIGIHLWWCAREWKKTEIVTLMNLVKSIRKRFIVNWNDSLYKLWNTEWHLLVSCKKYN